MAPRSDLPIEIDTTLNGSGAFVSSWADSAGFISVLPVWTDPGGGGLTVSFDYSLDASTVLRSVTVNHLVEVTIPARYFRLVVSGGSANATFRASIRAVS